MILGLSIFLLIYLIWICFVMKKDGTSIIRILDPALGEKIDTVRKFGGIEGLKEIEKNPKKLNSNDVAELQRMVGLDPHQIQTHYLEIHINDDTIRYLDKDALLFYDKGDAGCQIKAREIINQGFWDNSTKTLYSPTSIQKILIKEISHEPRN